MISHSQISKAGRAATAPLMLVVFLILAGRPVGGQIIDPMGPTPPPVTSRLQVLKPRVMRYPCRLVLNCDAALRTPTVCLISDPREWYLFDYSIGLVDDTVLGIEIRVLNFDDWPKRTPSKVSLANRTRLVIRITNDFSTDTALLKVELIDSLRVTVLRAASFVELEKLHTLPEGLTLVQLRGEDNEAVDSLVAALRDVARLTPLEAGYYQYVPFEVEKAQSRRRALNRTPMGYLLALQAGVDDSTARQRIMAVSVGKVVAWSRGK
jgi:hypothetical protein